MLKVQRSGAAAAHALNVHLRHTPHEPVVVQEQALHSLEHRGELPAQSIMAQIDYRSGLGPESRPGSKPKLTREIVPLEENVGECGEGEELGRDGPAEMIHTKVKED